MLGRAVTGSGDARRRPRRLLPSCQEQASYLQNPRLSGVPQELADNPDILHVLMRMFKFFFFF